MLVQNATPHRHLISPEYLLQKQLDQVDHKNMNPNDNRRKNLRVLPAKLNMSRQPARKPRRRK